ncbi:MAG: hypothetical protein IKO35_04720, partial [Elusimicrobiaceae bacterium]|nr:hypothetical protein [Elusimicrobiaceae bacterium]
MRCVKICFISLLAVFTIHTAYAQTQIIEAVAKGSASTQKIVSTVTKTSKATKVGKASTTVTTGANKVVFGGVTTTATP